MLFLCVYYVNTSLHGFLVLVQGYDVVCMCALMSLSVCSYVVVCVSYVFVSCCLCVCIVLMCLYEFLVFCMLFPMCAHGVLMFGLCMTFLCVCVYLWVTLLVYAMMRCLSVFSLCCRMLFIWCLEHVLRVRV